MSNYTLYDYLLFPVLKFLQVTLHQREVTLADPNRVLKVSRQLQKSDRANLENAQRAFVSFVQAYNKHECNIILRLKGNQPSLQHY